MSEFLLISFFSCAGLWLSWKLGGPALRWYRLRRKIKRLKPGQKFSARGKVYTTVTNHRNFTCVESIAEVIDYNEIKEVY